MNYEVTMSHRQVRIVEAEQLKSRQMLGIMVDAKDILLANIEGRLYAIDNKCSHVDALLYNGALKQDCVECPYTAVALVLNPANRWKNPPLNPSKLTPSVKKKKDIILPCKAAFPGEMKQPSTLSQL